ADGASGVALERDEVPDSRFYFDGVSGKVVIAKERLEDIEGVTRVLNEYEIDLVIHLGAQTIVPTANRDPLSTFRSNIEGTWNVLEAARRARANASIIVASSDKAYGDQEKLPYTEEMVPDPKYPYDVSKRCCELLSNSYSSTYGLGVTVTRLGNIYGPGDLNFSRIVPGTIRSIMRDESIQIRSDGKFTREYLYVKDAASAYLRLAEEPKKAKGQVFNVGSDERLTVLQVVEVISKKMGHIKKPEILNSAKGEIKDQYLSSAKMKAAMGWKSLYSFDKGLDETIAWYRDYLSR
ncbi:MAG: NAD-dependent epimerase/dehydratase family protein, partial [Candidatus Micrarchaeota archaeon]